MSTITCMLCDQEYDEELHNQMCSIMDNIAEHVIRTVFQDMSTDVTLEMLDGKEEDVSTFVAQFQDSEDWLRYVQASLTGG